MKEAVLISDKPIICIDFDGVIHSYVSGWQGTTNIPDPPTANAEFALESYIFDGFEVVILSSRSSDRRGRVAMYRWFQKHLPKLADRVVFATHKPPAVLTIDDRAFCFQGAFPSSEEIRAFRSWVQPKKELA